MADASVDVWKLVWALANGAAARGARILPYHRCVELRREGDAVTGARLHDERTGETVEVEAGFTINAVGRLGARDRARWRASRASPSSPARAS